MDLHFKICKIFIGFTWAKNQERSDSSLSRSSALLSRFSNIQIFPWIFIEPLFGYLFVDWRNVCPVFGCSRIEDIYFLARILHEVRKKKMKPCMTFLFSIKSLLYLGDASWTFRDNQRRLRETGFFSNQMVIFCHFWSKVKTHNVSKLIFPFGPPICFPSSSFA